MAKIKITYNPWEYRCADGCCYDYGVNVKVEVGDSAYHFDTYDENDALMQFIERHFGYVIETAYEHDEE